MKGILAINSLNIFKSKAIVSEWRNNCQLGACLIVVLNTFKTRLQKMFQAKVKELTLWNGLL